MDITRIDSRTPATEFSWSRAGVLTGVVLLVWFALDLVLRLTTSLPTDHTPQYALAVAFGVAIELDRRNRARRTA